ncbi:protein AIG1 [Biomphalaria glabrata]|nr:protein AIG1-like [Biomphalaria glabrata]
MKATSTQILKLNRDFILYNVAKTQENYTKSLRKDFRHVEERLLQTVTSFQHIRNSKTELFSEIKDLKEQIESLNNKIIDEETALKNLKAKVDELEVKVNKVEKAESTHSNSRGEVQPLNASTLTDCSPLNKYQIPANGDNQKMNKITIALIGTTGHGKSSTGNTILQRTAFKERESYIDGTPTLQSTSSTFYNHEFIVYDLPGLKSLIFSQEHVTKQIHSLMNSAKKIDLFILVFSFTNCFNDKDEEAFLELQTIFGKEFLRNHGMIAVTHGDKSFHDTSVSNVSTNQAFKKWFEKSGRKLKRLNEMVNDRFFLISNKGSFENNGERIKSSNKLHEIALDNFKMRSAYTYDRYHKTGIDCRIF